MKKITLKYVIIITILLGFWSKTTSLLAQSIWLPQSDVNSITIEALKPNFDSEFGFSTASAAIFLSGRFSIKENVFFIVELPFVHSNRDEIKIVNPATGEIFFQIDPESETMIGNPYIGFEFHRTGSRIFTEVGIQAPIASDDKPDAAQFGVSADFDRIEAFAPHLLKISGKINYYNKNSSNVVVRLRGGPTVWIPTEEGDAELLADYSAQVGYVGKQISIIGCLTGRMIFTESDIYIGEWTFYHFVAAAFLFSAALHTCIIVKSQYVEPSSYISDVFGVTLAIQLK